MSRRRAAAAAAALASSSATPDACFFTDGDTTSAPTSRGESIPLVLFEDSGFRVNDAALDVLAGFEPPLAVVSVAGVYRTGKSFLLNRVILKGEGKFTVGPTTRACTKGIWMWTEPIVATDKKGNKTNVVVIDTEGIGATTADATHDTRIFALGLLLSSYFIYNSVGSIDEQALDRMSLVTNLSKEIRGRVKVKVVEDGNGDESGMEVSDDDDDEEDAAPLRHSFPAFLWVVRDFALQLRDADGRAIGAKEYLEDALKDCDGKNTAAAGKNRIRATLREFFPERDCYTMVRPCTDESQLQLLDTLPDKSLRPEFLEQARELRARVVDEALRRPLKVNECELSGSMLGLLCRQYVEAINAGHVPVIQDAWSYVCDAQRAKTEAKLLADFQATLGSLQTQPDVLTPGQFAAASNKALQHALDQLEATCRRLYPHESPEPQVASLQHQLVPLEKNALKQFHTQYMSSLTRAAGAAQREVEAAMGRQEYTIAEFRKALHKAHQSFLAKYVDADVDDDSVRDSANAAWYVDADTLVWRAINEYYSLREQQLTSLKGETERLQLLVQDMSKNHATALAAQEKALRDAAAHDTESWSSKVRLLERSLAAEAEKTQQHEQELADLDARLSRTMQEASDAERALRQTVAAEHDRLEAAEATISELREDLEDAEQVASQLQQLQKDAAATIVERDQLRLNLEDTRSQLEQARRDKDKMFSDFEKEAHEYAQSLLISKENYKKRREEERTEEKRKAREEKDRLKAKFKKLEDDYKVNFERVEEECSGLRNACRRLEESLKQHESLKEEAARTATELERQVGQLREALGASKVDVENTKRECAAQLEADLELKKALERETMAARTERRAVEEDLRRQLREMEMCKEAAEREAAKYKKELHKIEGTESRKRQRPDTDSHASTSSMEVEMIKSQLDMAGRNLSSKEQELQEVRSKNRELEERLAAQMRETTKLTRKYDKKLAQVKERERAARGSRQRRDSDSESGSMSDDE